MPSTPELPTELPDTDAPSVRLSLDELAALTGLSARTVRYYIQQGLVSRPTGAKRGAYYERRHVEQLLLVRRWTQAGHSLDRVRELLDGAPEDPAPRAVAPGTVAVWSRMTVADGLEVHVEPGRADLTPEALRTLMTGITRLYREVRAAAEPTDRSDAPSAGHAAASHADVDPDAHARTGPDPHADGCEDGRKPR